ncbi:MAG: phosphopantetheine-binding protein, partial [Amylibacter sp.]
PTNVTAFTPLENSVEQQIAVIWARILGVAKVNPSDNFFDLGGHSLLAVQAHREIKAEMRVDQLSITDIFRFPVLSALASQVETKSGVTTKPESKLINALETQTRDNTISRRKAMRARRLAGAS